MIKVCDLSHSLQQAKPLKQDTKTRALSSRPHPVTRRDLRHQGAAFPLSWWYCASLRPVNVASRSSTITPVPTLWARSSAIFMRNPWLPCVPFTRLQYGHNSCRLRVSCSPSVAQGHDVVDLEPEMMRLVEAAAGAHAPLHRVQSHSHRFRHVLTAIAVPAPAGRSLLVHLHRLQVLLQQRHVHRAGGLAVQVAAAADPHDQLGRRLAVALRGIARQIRQFPG